jgi:glycosyltransferase involved in cell wall biosynthesis
MEGVRQIARAAQAWGQQTTVVSLDAPGAPYLEGNPFEVVALGPGVTSYGYSRRVVPWLRAHAREFDAVIVNGIWHYCSFAVWRALHGTGVPYFVFPHGMLDPYFKRAYPLKHLKKSLYWPWAEYRVLRDARAVLFTCEEERLLARRSFALYRCKEEVAGFGTAPSPFEAQAAKSALFTAYPHLRDKRLLIFLGRIHEKKGCDLLIEAFAAISGSDRAWHLVMAGPCEEPLGRVLRARTAALGLGERVTWTGMLQGESKWGLLHAAEVFALPSHQENFGIAVVEALACGTPVLVSNRVNIWREICQDEAGFTAADTPEGTRQLLLGWNALPASSRDRMRSNAAGCFARRFHIGAIAQGLVDRVKSLDPAAGQAAG